MDEPALSASVRFGAAAAPLWRPAATRPAAAPWYTARAFQAPSTGAGPLRLDHDLAARLQAHEDLFGAGFAPVASAGAGVKRALSPPVSPSSAKSSSSASTPAAGQVDKRPRTAGAGGTQWPTATTPGRAVSPDPDLDAGRYASWDLSAPPPNVPVLLAGEGTHELMQHLSTRDDLFLRHPLEAQRAIKRANPQLMGNRISVIYNTAAFRRASELNSASVPVDLIRFTRTLRDHLESLPEPERCRFADSFGSLFDVLLWFNARKLAPSLKVIQDGMSAMADVEGPRWSKLTYGTGQPGKDIARLKRASNSGGLAR